MNFRFSSKGNPMDYVSRLAGYMQTYPPNLSVAGANLIYRYELDLVRELLSHLVPSNMLLLAVGREFKGKTDKVKTKLNVLQVWVRVVPSVRFAHTLMEITIVCGAHADGWTDFCLSRGSAPCICVF